MKGLKFALVVLGLLGIVALFLPYVSSGGFSMKMWDARNEEALKVYLPLFGFGLAALMGLLASRAGLSRLHAVLALIGFGLAMLVKEVRIGLKGEGGLETAIGGKLLFLAAAIGLAVSLIALVKPERS
ncbi:MAG TPA: hypothetical protein VK698_28895 [Kofleriaceae bacterium]|jgi:peptidoglycan/LPS O-acetylase OafA/YrhL|nr:hypothetical protein [Kofleriaceae bacterium]